eukprot:CAMPEP_0198143892 /NCGR_PEP_ID=MMETSP1443-20131203/11420_1 /TAXON_ID=186043 /ORGANISM="Entomoneis sp., Strain CCMP2396" /LENGTH=285 /DNA_ID=CAMNT_0043807195 /DNA_START=51 /DNA_END=904 /DNA_ORIENTATION=-
MVTPKASPTSVATQSDEDLIYSLYKQATKGDAPQQKKFTFRNKRKSKKKAWKQLKDIPEEKLGEAMKHVAMALQILKLEREKDSSSTESESVPVEETWKKNSNSAGGPSFISSDGETAENTSHVSSDDFFVAAGADDVDTVRNLLNKGVPCSRRDECGQTALHMAADNGAERTLKLLLERGAKVDSADQHGVSILQAAVIGGHLNICKILLEKGADPDQQDEDGDTPYTCAMDDGSPELQDLFDDGEEEGDQFDEESAVSWKTEFTIDQKGKHNIIDRIPSLLDV